MAASEDRWPWRAAVVDLLQRDRLAQPDELGAVAAAAAAPLGLDVWVYLVDQEQRVLLPVPRPPAAPPPPLPVESTVAGQVFMTVRPRASTVDGRQRLWMPLLDGTERLGVLEFGLGDGGSADDPALLAGCDLFGQLVGHLVATKMPYGDALLQVRRQRRMSEASELLWRLQPPMTFVSERAVVSAVLEPCYEVGGDAFDYAANDGTLFFAIFDTAGHELRAGLGTAVVMSAIRAARRGGEGIAAMARAADRALERHLPELRFTTAVLAELDLDSGRLRYVNAGHPPPLLIRRGRVLRGLDGGKRLPLGLGEVGVGVEGRDEVAEELLERGDRLLLYTDGATEAVGRDGRVFGVEGLVELVERDTGELPAPETLRRLCHSALADYEGAPADDVTLLLVEWGRDAARRMLPLATPDPVSPGGEF
ncbi:PP2C family protein-serine/threonine phosphatase [Dactylosporangium sp. NPDC049742]|uniref:PP2C family protein-serine/threonine phosphatase n=1 Tax=Dactylosporangium sp. NPDC049742 TaxID=3154737 RepID=UPI003418D6B8